MKGGKLNNMDRALNSVEADCFLMGHTHEKIVARKVRNVIKVVNGVPRHVAHDMMMANIGTYLRTYASSTEPKASEYGEICMYEPVSIGMLRMVITPRYKRVEGRI